MVHRGLRASCWSWFVLLSGLASYHAAPLEAQAPTLDVSIPSADDPSEPAGYSEAVDEAVREFAAHNYEEARALFARAHALYPNARTERGLGLTQFELRNYGESIGHFEAALRSQVRPLPPDLRADTEQMLARARNFVALVRLDTRPVASRVLLDGLQVEVPEGGALLVQVGDHMLEVQAPGFVPDRRRLSVQGGEERTLTIVLSHAPAPSVPTRPAIAKPWYKSPWLWAAAGVVIVGAATGTAYALTRPEEQPRAYGGTAGAVLRGP